MEPIDITRYPLPTPILKSLLTLVEIAKRNQVMSLFYTWQQSRESGAFDLMIDDHEKGEYVTVSCLKEDPIAVLEKLGFVERLSKNKVFLHPAAFERVNYEHKNRPGYEKMTRRKTVTFTDGKWVFIPTRAMSYVYELKYSVVDTDFVGEPEELSRTEHGSIVVGISMPLATAWELSDESSREKVLFEYAKQHIKDQVFNNTLSEREELQLTGSIAPQKCPFDPERIEISFDKPFEFPVAGELETAKSTKTTVQIFLCYAREDEEKVEKLYQKLSDAGFKPWMAKKDLVGGERWKSRISQAIRRSDLFLACLSANSIDKRGWVQREIKDALDIWQEMLDSDIYLIPVRLEDCEVPERLREFQWVDLFEDDGWTQLVKAIQVGMERRAETPIESIAKAVETEPVQTSVTIATATPALQKTYTLAPSRTLPATRRSVARIGDTIPEVGLAKEDLSMTLIGWAESDIAVKGPYAGNELYTFTARPGMKFIILEFEFHNNWVREQKTPYFNEGEVRTGKGYFYQVWSPPVGIHSEEYAPRPSTQEEVENLGESGALEDLLPEESVRGHVVFEIPEDEEPEEVELSQVPVPIKLD